MTAKPAFDFKAAVAGMRAAFPQLKKTVFIDSDAAGAKQQLKRWFNRLDRPSRAEYENLYLDILLGYSNAQTDVNVPLVVVATGDNSMPGPQGAFYHECGHVLDKNIRRGHALAGIIRNEIFADCFEVLWGVRQGALAWGDIKTISLRRCEDMWLYNDTGHFTSMALDHLHAHVTPEAVGAMTPAGILALAGDYARRFTPDEKMLTPTDVKKTWREGMPKDAHDLLPYIYKNTQPLSLEFYCAARLLTAKGQAFDVALGDAARADAVKRIARVYPKMVS